MASLNKVMLIGNLGRDPEVRTMQNGDKVANLSLACSESWKSKDGERKERTEWVRVVIFGPLAEIAERYAVKGSKLYLSGSMQTRKWTDKDGADKYTTEVVLQPFRGELVLLDSKTSGDADEPERDGGWDAPTTAAKPAARYGSQRQAARTDYDDDIPF